MILLLAMVAILYYWPESFSWPESFRDIKSSSVTFDCDVDFYNWKAAWSDNKKLGVAKQQRQPEIRVIRHTPPEVDVSEFTP